MIAKGTPTIELRAVPPRRGPARVHLVPAPDRRRSGQVLVVRWPSDGPHAGQVLPAEGRWLTLDHYWLARLRDGDVIDNTNTTPPEEA